MAENVDRNVKELDIFALAMDPIYIGTGGYTIGRVDNTIVRDPITNVPKIPGSSLAGTWRYYVTLEAISYLKNKLASNCDKIIDELEKKRIITSEEKEKLKNEKDKLNFSSFNFLQKSIKKNLGRDFNDDNFKKSLSESIKSLFSGNEWKEFEGNRFLQVTCAGQDNLPQEDLASAPFAEKNGKTGHCGHCIVCKGFGFTKRDISWQGQIFFSDLSIAFFPVFTMRGTKWITTASILKNLGIEIASLNYPKIKTKSGNENYLNLGWLYLEVEGSHKLKDDDLKCFEFRNGDNKETFSLKPEDVIIVPEDLFSHIVNSNLEVRTSVSIDPITGAAKEGALFTSEAIPRGTVFYGKIRIFDKSVYEELEPRLKPLPKSEQLIKALESSKHYYETLGIGGMTTRGFGRLKIRFSDEGGNGNGSESSKQ